MKIGHTIGTTKDSEAAPTKAPEKRPRTPSALLCQSRLRGDHTRPGCCFPRPRGKPCAPGCIKRPCKVRAHHGEPPNAFRYPSASQLPHPPSVFICVHLWLKTLPFFACISPCPSTAVQPSPTQSNHAYRGGDSLSPLQVSPRPRSEQVKPLIIRHSSLPQHPRRVPLQTDALVNRIAKPIVRPTFGFGPYTENAAVQPSPTQSNHESCAKIKPSACLSAIRHSAFGIPPFPMPSLPDFGLTGGLFLVRVMRDFCALTLIYD